MIPGAGSGRGGLDRAAAVRGRSRLVAGSLIGSAIVLVLIVAGPASGAGPLDNTPLASTAVGQIELPSLPVPIPSVPLPTLPLPTPRLTLPPLPTPRPTLPPPPTVLPSLPTVLPSLPTVLPSLPTELPSLPVPSVSPTLPSPSDSPLPSPTEPDRNAGGAGPSGSPPPVNGASPGGADPANVVFLGNGTVGPQPSAPSVVPDGPAAGVTPSMRDLIAPGLLVGIPLLTLLLILAGQLGLGSAWLPVVRRWLNRPLIPGGVQPAPSPAGRADSRDPGT
jgi:hypothetical protein